MCLDISTCAQNRTRTHPGGKGPRLARPPLFCLLEWGALPSDPSLSTLQERTSLQWQTLVTKIAQSTSAGQGFMMLPEVLRQGD